VSSPNPYWNIFFTIVGPISLLWLVLVYPLAYFFLYRPFDRRFERIGIETIERGWPYGGGIRTVGYAADIVLEPWRGKKIKNRVLARYVESRFEYQAHMFGPVNFRKAATPFQIGVAYFVTYGMIWSLLHTALFALHDFVLFREFSKANRG